MAVKETQKYTEGIGRRKSAVARVRLSAGGSRITVNGKDLAGYFPIKELQETVLSPLKTAAAENKYSISVRVLGSGIVAQAGAIRLGIARALTKIDEGWRKNLKPAGFLKRDPRRVERKKYGLKKARRAPQWSKR